MLKVLRKGKIIVVGMLVGGIVSSTSVSAQTREFVFHMDTSYAHGKFPNCGYVASKADNEQYAYITVNQFDKVNSPIVSMWVAPNGGTSELTYPWSWDSVQPTKKLGYINYRAKGSSHQLCAEQFYSGSVVIGGRWTP